MSEKETKQYFGDMPPFTKQDCEDCYEYRKLQEENEELKEKLKETNKGLEKVISRSTKYKNKYHNIKHNWSKLEKWLKEENEERFCSDIAFIEILNKMQEIKGSGKNA